MTEMTETTFATFRDRIMAAENTGDPAVFEELLAEDAVIQAPGMPAIEGREACLHFVREVLAGLHGLYERQVLCESAELLVQGDVAIDRGRFSQTLSPRDGAHPSEEEGHYLWMYRRQPDGAWRLARIIGSVQPNDPSSTSGSPRAESRGDSYTPIGFVHSPYTEKTEIPKGPGAEHNAEGVIEIRPSLEEGLTDIEGFSHLYVIWVFDRADGCELMAQPPTDDRPHGVFATRSPQRPNPIGLTVVRLLRREGRHLYVRGVDMLDGTPVLDIKPYLSSVPVADLKRGWLEGKA
jgi:tRNA-Thr(GGU) m(6)t(6)A37 methyltransferase TsaA